MIFILWFVFFIICDEKWYKIWFENNNIVFNEIEKKSDSVEVQFDPNAVYKNSDLIRINPEFQNPINLSKGKGVDKKYLAKLEREKKLEEERIYNQEKLHNRTFENDTILSAFEWWEKTWTVKQETKEKTWTVKQETKEKTWTVKQETKQRTWTVKQEAKQKTWTVKQETKEKTWTVKQETKQKTWMVKQEAKQKTWTVKQETKQKTWITEQESKWNTWKVSDSKTKSWSTTKTEVPIPVVIYYPIEKYEHVNHVIDLSKWAEIPKVKIVKYAWREVSATNLMKGKEQWPLYKNSNRIKIYSWFENTIALRNSAGIDEEFLLRQKNSKPTIITLNDNDTISSTLHNDFENDNYVISWYDGQKGIDSDLDSISWSSSSEYNIPDEEKIAVTWTFDGKIDDKNLENSGYQQNIESKWIEIQTWKNIEDLEQVTYKVEKYEWQNHIIDLSKWEEQEKVLVKVDKYEPEEHIVDLKNGVTTEIVEDNSYVKINKPSLNYHTIDLSRWEGPEKILVKVDKYSPEIHTANIRNGVVPEIIDENTVDNIDWNRDIEEHADNDQNFVAFENNDDEKLETIEEENYIFIQKPEFLLHSTYLSKWKAPEIILVKIEKYPLNIHTAYLRKWKFTEHDFIVENTPETAEQAENWLSNEMLDSLLENEEIDINTLESENDEILQKVFEQTKDTEVMNLIVETYLNEYQFVNAKNFIENLPDMYRQDLKPSLNLRVAFNSFALSSKTINENLSAIVQDYSSKNEISDEDKKRYLWIIALMDRNYDHFFEIATWFTSEKNVSFASKLQWYKDQIAKQMWMPDYYFDTLVSLELFNQWLFQPAKVLALYSLQQNSNYILPYQVLAYANFLTNSRDTSIEYLKKLMDLDPNNVEKYRFLMWVAFYRDERYEQSVVMFSMIKDESLRLDTQRYLINDYIKLDQKNKLIASRNKLLWYENLVASDFYTYFYETFFHPYSEWTQFQLYAYDRELANKMLRVCSITLKNEEKAVCTYGTIGRNIAMWQFDGLEQYLLNLATEYPQWYLYQALWDYYIQQWDLEKAKVYLIKAISLTQNRSERSQIKKLLQDAM